MDADALICSHPRSGGRWLRFLLAHYLAARKGLDVDVGPKNVFSIVPDHHDESRRGYPAFRYRGRSGVPLVSVCHQPYTWELHRGFPILFLARNPYDVVVSAYFYLHEKGQHTGGLREFLQHRQLGLPAWIEYMNSWAARLLTHRDVTYIAYGELSAEAPRVLRRVLEFLDERPEPALIDDAVLAAASLRAARKIRTGQEGNFWDHLQPEEIFEVQATVREELSEFALPLLASIGVAVDPFPRMGE
ncbi:MAG: sulfotransferase domain-containing protein [Gemmatimonadota bacterium]